MQCHVSMCEILERLKGRIPQTRAEPPDRPLLMGCSTHTHILLLGLGLGFRTAMMVDQPLFWYLPPAWCFGTSETGSLAPWAETTCFILHIINKTL